MIVDRVNFSIEKGDPRRFRTDTDAWRTFCPSCGTSLTYEADHRADQVDLTTGGLDHPEAFPPTEDTWTEERISWVALVERAQDLSESTTAAVNDPFQGCDCPNVPTP